MKLIGNPFQNFWLVLLLLFFSSISAKDVFSRYVLKTNKRVTAVFSERTVHHENA